MTAGKKFTLQEALNQYGTEELRLMARLFGPAPATRKQDRIKLILKGLEGDGLKWALDKLDDISRKAATEAAYNPNGRFDQDVFRTKYGTVPKEWNIWDAGSNHFFSLFIINGFMPIELRERLRKILPPPPEMKPQSFRELPEKVDGAPLIARETEAAALHDIMNMLHLVAGDMVTITSQRQEVTTHAVRTIIKHLHSDERVPNEILKSSHDAIRAHALPLIVIVAQFAREGETSMELRREGQKALETSAHENIRLAWERWVATNRYNELSYFDNLYVDMLGGEDLQKLRRSVIDTLVLFPSGEWIETNHLLGYMRATGRMVRLGRQAFHPSFFSRSGYNRGYDHNQFMEMVETTFLLTFLEIFATTMGILDAAYTMLENRKEGHYKPQTLLHLKYIRITPLGAWCLGLSKTYETGGSIPRQTIKVLPTLDVMVPDSGKVIRWEVFFLDRIALHTAEHIWKLDAKKTLSAMEQGISIDRIRRMLEIGGEPLPPTVDRFFSDMEARATALRYTNRAIIFEARDEAIADLIAHERKLQGMCLRAGERSIVVLDEKRKEFLKTIKKMGYLVKLPNDI